MMTLSRFLTSAAFVLFVAGCATPTPEREMNAMASALTKLAAAVDATVRYDNPPAGLPDTELLQLATAHDPSLAAPFAKMDVRVQRDGQNSSVLVCRARGGQAMLEDAGCTAMMERHHWTSPTPLVCQATLDLSAVCSK